MFTCIVTGGDDVEQLCEAGEEELLDVYMYCYRWG